MQGDTEDAHGLVEKPSYPQLLRWVEEAWEALPEEYLGELICSIPARCQAVINANGMHTKYGDSNTNLPFSMFSHFSAGFAAFRRHHSPKFH